MNYKYSLIVLVAAVVVSCTKDGANNSNTFLVSASKMIAIKGHAWDEVEPQLKKKKGYRYIKAPDSRSNDYKAVVDLPAIDDSNRSVKGRVLLNIGLDNRIFHASLNADSLPKAEAYAMMFNYNSESLKTLSRITDSIGGIQENNIGWNDKVSVVLAKLDNRIEADQLAITYRTNQSEFTMVVFRQNDGRYVFS
jgi:hypothetical protein